MADPGTLDPGAEALSGIGGPELWWLLELLWGLSAGIAPATNTWPFIQG